MDIRNTNTTSDRRLHGG